jgi:hypothetical protein
MVGSSRQVRLSPYCGFDCIGDHAVGQKPDEQRPKPSPKIGNDGALPSRQGSDPLPRNVFSRLHSPFEHI